MNRYNAIKRLNKSNFINLLSVCSEETLQEIFPVKKHDLLKLISDRLTKAELQDIMYNLEEIETEDIVTEYDIRIQKLEEMKEAQRERDKPNNVKRVPMPEFETETVKKTMASYVRAYNRSKGNEKKQQDLFKVINDKSKKKLVEFYNQALNILRQREIPVFEEIHEILLQALSSEQQSAIRVGITELEL